MIQESVFGKACAQNFDQAQPVQKVLPIRNRGQFWQTESLGCRRSQNRFLNHFRYNMQRCCFCLVLIAFQLLSSCTSGGYSRPYISEVTQNEVASEYVEPR